MPRVAAEYFGISTLGAPTIATGHPRVMSAFYPGHGWRLYPGVKRVSISVCRKLRAEGATAIALDCVGRTADFRIEELCRG